jgi:hypothetical protein
LKPEKSLGTASVMTAVIYAALILVFTLVGMAVAPAEAQVGTARPASAIPEHLTELVGFGVLLGCVSAVIYGRRGLPMLALTPALVALLDLDHLPAYIGLTQPIRPAHSLVFIAVALVCTAIILRRLDLELILVSSFTGHLGVDQGLFAPLSPLSFDYIQLDPYRMPLLICAVATALIAGYSWRRSSRGKTVR